MKITAISLALLGSVLASQSALATTVFQDNFNNYFNGTAYNSTQSVAYGQQAGSGRSVYLLGEIPTMMNSAVNWGHGSNGRAIQAVDFGSGNYGVMLGTGDYMFTDMGAAANQVGTSYTISLNAALTANNDAGTVTQPGDKIKLEVRDSAGSIGSYLYTVPTNTDTLASMGFSYQGSGNGDAYIIISEALDPSNSTYRYAGVIDDLIVSSSATNQVVPEPASLALLGTGLFGLGMVRRRRQG